MPASEFFNVRPVANALDALFAHWTPTPGSEICDPRQALGRLLAVTPSSPIDLPEFTRSTMDGYAVHAADTFGASPSLPAYLTCIGAVKMGATAALDVGRGQTVEISTGAMLPPGADAVVMVERTQAVDQNQIEVLSPVAPGENVLQVGEDVSKGSELFPVGHRLRPQDIGSLLAVGLLSVQVVVPPRVGILSCGDELIPPDQIPAPGQIRDVNAYTLAGLVQELGGTPTIFGIARDTLEDFGALAQAAFRDSDMLIITAGSSVSVRDLTREVIASLGQPGILQHGLAVKPGKPTIVAVCDGKPVIGLPGNPASAFLVARQIVAPIIRRALGGKPPLSAVLQARLASNIPSSTGREDTIPVRLIREEEGLIAEPVFGKSNLINTLAQADGLVVIPLNSNGLRAGTLVDVTLF